MGLLHHGGTNMSDQRDSTVHDDQDQADSDGTAVIEVG